MAWTGYWMLKIEDYGALLFDLDGTLVDTMPLHYRAYAQVFAKLGLTLTEPAFMSVVGAPAPVAIPKMLAAIGADARDSAEVAAIHEAKKAAFLAILADAPPRALPASAVLAEWHERKPTALVSSGNRAGVNAIVERMGWQGWFDAIVGGDETARGKPHPDPYLHAATMLGVDPAICLVFEDTDDGLAAATSAGMGRIDVRVEPLGG